LEKEVLSVKGKPASKISVEVRLLHLYLARERVVIDLLVFATIIIYERERGKSGRGTADTAE
jgi:hypothetical protein